MFLHKNKGFRSLEQSQCQFKMNPSWLPLVLKRHLGGWGVNRGKVRLLGSSVHPVSDFLMSSVFMQGRPNAQELFVLPATGFLVDTFFLQCFE